MKSEAARDQGWTEQEPPHKADRTQLLGYGTHDHRDDEPCPVRLCPRNSNLANRENVT